MKIVAADFSEAVFSRRFMVWLKSSLTALRPPALGLARPEARPERGLSEALEDDSEDSFAFAALFRVFLGALGLERVTSSAPKGREALE